METNNGLAYIPKIGTESVVVYDIETATAGSRPNADKDILKFFGYYSYKIGKGGIIPYTDKESIQKVIDSHKFMVGFNNETYDDVVLKRSGISLEYKRIIDLRKIFKNRAGSMFTKKGLLSKKLMKYSLDYITRFLDIVDENSAKDEIDYNIFKKNSWTSEEVAKIKFYTARDVEITKKLYEWLEDYFDMFKDFLPKIDIEKKYYLTDTMAKFGYKADCYAMDWEPIYDKNAFKTDNRPKLAGGYVAYPAGEKFSAEKIIENNVVVGLKNKIIQLDYSSEYPHIMIQANLHSRNKHCGGWHGGKLFQVEGYYNNEELGGLAKLFRKWYYLRLFYKRKGILEDGTVFYFNNVAKYLGKNYISVSEERGHFELEIKQITDKVIKTFSDLYEQGVDRREYTIKILLNLQYGILNHPYYQLVFDDVAGADCTRLGRQWVKYARKIYKKEGYPLVYSDTDSWYFIDVFNDKQKYLDLKEKIIKDIKDSFKFPQLTFDADIDAEIKHIFFFKGKNSEDKESDKEMDEDDFINKPKGLMKKNYIYVTTDNKLIIKNLGIAKKNISALSKEIFWKHMVPNIINEGKIKFEKTHIENLMRTLLIENIELAYMRKAVNDLSAYGKSPNGIQAQITRAYGPGIHFLIPNKRNIGVGKGIRYCSIEEFKKYKMDIGDIDFTNFWKELNYFVKERVQPKLFDYFGGGK